MGFNKATFGTVLPDVHPMYRGVVFTVRPCPDGESGTADVAYICLQKADGNLAWYQLAATT